MYLTYDVFWHWVLIVAGVTIAVLGFFIYNNHKRIKALEIYAKDVEEFADLTKKAIKFLADAADHNADIYESDRAAILEALEKKKNK